MKRVRVTRSDVDQAVAGGVISVDQADALWAAWSTGASAAPDVTPRFSITHVLYYLGGLIAIGAMTLFMNLGWERFGPWALFAIAVAYGVGCILTSRSLAARGLMLPAGILATLAIVLVPLATWALQSAFGWWPPGGAGEHYRAYHTHIDWRWITLEFATLIAAVIGLWRLRYPFMVMPLAVTLWYMSMDLARMIVFADRPGWNEWQFYKNFSSVFGLGMRLCRGSSVDRACKSFAGRPLLCLLVVLLRHIGVLGRAHSSGVELRTWQVHLHADQPWHGGARRHPRTARVCSVWRHRHCVLPRPPVAPGVRGQPGLPVRADADRLGDRRHRHRVAAQ